MVCVFYKVIDLIDHFVSEWFDIYRLYVETTVHVFYLKVKNPTFSLTETITNESVFYAELVK